MASDRYRDDRGGEARDDDGNERIDRRPGDDGGSTRADAAPVHCARRPLLPVIELEHAVVQYRDRPDRCTIFSPRASGVARLSTWLSADVDALCSLEEWR